jgi:protein-tyrosine phosphatase
LIDSILVVCVGNICRSPVGAQLLSVKLAQANHSVVIGSAGIGAMVGKAADPVVAELAQARGLSLQGHIARQFTREIGMQHSLILVMETRHRQHILQNAPHLAGRIMLFDHWTGARGISDPYKRSPEFHEAVYTRIEEAAAAWSARLSGRKEQPA